MEAGTLSPFIRATLKIGENGRVTAPDNIIQTVSAAYEQYTSLRQDHIERIAVYAAIEGMIGGNPPYDQEELDAAGLGHIANFNNFKGRSAYEKAAQGYWNLVNAVEVMVKIVLSPSVGPDRAKWAGIIARHFSDVMKEWEDFVPNFNLLGAQLTKFGLCPIFFPHEESPIWEVVDVSKFYIPSQALTFVSKLTNVCIDTAYTVQDLYQIYKDDLADWNKEALADFLILRANNFTQNTQAPFLTMMEVQRFIDTNSNDVMRYFTDTVKLVNMYQKEYTGGVSHYIFSADLFQTNKGKENTTADFLYFVDRQYKSMEDAIVIFTASPGEWNIHSNVGVGQKMFAGTVAVNMLDCNIIDMAKMAGTPLIRSLATGGRNMDPIRFYPGVATDIGAAEAVVNNFGANINQSILASQYTTSGLDTNATNSGDDPGMPDRVQGSLAPSQARAKDFKEFGGLKNVVAHFYTTFDKPIRISFIRFLTMKENAPGYELAKEFKRRCKDDGVPDFLFDTAKKGLHGLPAQYRSVKAARVAGDGSTLARIMGLESLGPILPTFNEKQLNAYKRDYVSATVGVDYLDQFADDNVGDEVSGGASLARTEDNLMKLGGQPLFSADNDQSAHADEHMGSLSAIVGAVAQQQMSPVDADKIMALGVPHLTEHIQFMQKAPQFYRDTLNRLKEPYGQLVKWAQLNRRNAEAMIQAAMKKQAEDAAATETVMNDAQRKDFVAQADVARDDRKVEAQNERADKANETRADIMREKARTDADTKRLAVELEADAKQNATAKGREQTELAASSPAELSNQLAGMIGNTPSTVDFEVV